MWEYVGNNSLQSCHNICIYMDTLGTGLTAGGVYKVKNCNNLHICEVNIVVSHHLDCNNFIGMEEMN